MDIALQKVETTTRSFNAKCEGGKVIEYVQRCTKMIDDNMRYNARMDISDHAGRTKTVVDGKIVKKVVNAKSTQISEKIGTVQGKGVFMIYRLRPFFSEKLKPSANMKNAIVLKWGNGNAGSKSIKIFTNGAIISAGWPSYEKFKSVIDDILDDIFKGARLVDGQIRTILYNTRSAIDVDSLSCSDLMQSLRRRHHDQHVFINFVNVSLSVQFMDNVRKRSRVLIDANGDVKVFSKSVEDNDQAWAFIKEHVVPCVADNQRKGVA